MKKTTLKVTKAELAKNLLPFAIASAESDLRICLILNHALQIQLSLSENFELTIKKSQKSFRKYSYESEEGIEKYSLFINRNGSDYLMPEIKNIDYILLIQSEGPLGKLEEKIMSLKSVPEITAVYRLDTVLYKSVNRLLG